MQEDLRQSIKDAYMRGFRAAVNSEDIGPAHPDSHLGRGYTWGVVALGLAIDEARANARRVLDSDALAQAQANAAPYTQDLKDQIIKAVLEVLPPCEPRVEFDDPTEEQIERREISGRLRT